MFRHRELFDSFHDNTFTHSNCFFREFTWESLLFMDNLYYCHKGAKKDTGKD